MLFTQQEKLLERQAELERQRHQVRERQTKLELQRRLFRRWLDSHLLLTHADVTTTPAVSAHLHD